MEHYIGEPQKVQEYSLGVSMEDTKYVDAVKAKDELALMYGEKIKNYIKVKSFENILRLMDESLTTYFDQIAYGIYSIEELNEIRNSIRGELPINKKKEEEEKKRKEEEMKIEKKK